jgi:hypothetical protein
VILGLKRVFWEKEHNGGHDESLKWQEKKKLTMGLKLSGICSTRHFVYPSRCRDGMKVVYEE